MSYTLLPLPKTAMICFALAALAIFTFWDIPRTQPARLSQTRPTADPDLERSNSASSTLLVNSTLGFQRVFGIVFPSRTDKKDRVTLTSSLTGFNVDWLPGVAGEDIPIKAAPPTWDHARKPGELGCWRAHMNALQRIISERISTALIIEDDADWDILLKSQLRQVDDALHLLTNTHPKYYPPTYAHPNWDMLWLGHCRAGPSDTLQPVYIIANDPTVPPLPHRRVKWRQSHIPPAVLDNSTRLVFRNYASMCTAAYAVTFSGAQKILAAVSLTPQNQPVDMSYSSLCRGKLVPGFSCYSVYPPLFGSYRPAGPASRDSDINDKTDKWHEEYTYDIVYSVAQNVGRLVVGETMVRAQWEDVERPEMEVDKELPLGDVQMWELGTMEQREIHGVNIW